MKKVRRRISLRQRRFQNPNYDHLAPDQKRKATHGA
jgi:hypothetical protein